MLPHEPPDDYALQLADALEAIDTKVFARLCGYVRARLYHVLLYLPEYEPADLVQEAIVRTADGRRTWPTEFPFPLYLKRCMDSIANELYTKYSKRPDWKDWNSEQHYLEHHESNMYAEHREARLLKRLAGDAEATAVLNSRLEGYTPAEACKMLGIDAATYESARKRVKRAWEMVNRDE